MAEGGSRTIRLEQSVLYKNQDAAQLNRGWLEERGVVALNLISSPGTGKTALLERTLEELRGKKCCAVIVGDQRTDRDAKRLLGKGAQVRQIETITSCHLDANRVRGPLQEIVTEGTEILFIENVGNLICPAAFDLGEQFKVVLLSVTEGEDKPAKYPVVFSKAHVVVVTKIDLVPHLDWDRNACLEYIRKASPNARVFELSARTGEGMSDWLGYLETLSCCRDTSA